MDNNEAMPSREELIAAANANEWVQRYRKEKEWWSPCWTEECISKNPPMRVEFEHATFFGSLSEAISMRRGKNSWGKLVAILPLRTEDFLHPCRVVYQLKPTSKQRQRWEWRDHLRHILGKNRRLVNQALRHTLKDFQSDLDEEERRVLRYVLRLDAVEFWRRVRHGDRYSPNAVHRFIRLNEERWKGYRLDFGATPPLEQEREIKGEIGYESCNPQPS
jgi:hypothetical protein